MQKIKFYHGLVSSFKGLRTLTPLARSTRFIAPYTHSSRSAIFSHNSPYAQFSSKQGFMSEIEDIIDIETGKKPTGRLVICPTPIGNIRDISIRQYEALLECDIIACEDTRNTGKLFKMFKDKRIKEKFYEKFEIDLNEVKDVTIDDFGSKDEEEFFDNLEEPESVRKARKILNGLDSLGFMGRNEEMDDESMYGLEDQFILSLKRKIKEVREKKGRGLMISYYKDNEDRRIAKLIKCLQYNFAVALVSDAGTPTISDPGYKLVNEAHKQNINVESLPGPSVVSVALSSSGFPSDRFMFEGYASKTPTMKIEKLEKIRDMEITCVLFESKARVMKTLLTVEKIFGENQMVSVGFEYTKMYEAIFRGRVKEVFEKLEKEEKERELKGEITIVIAPHSASYNSSLQEKSTLDAEKVKNAEGLYTVNVEQLVKVMQDKLEAGDKQMALLLVDMLGISKNKAMQHISKVKYPESPLAKKLLGF